MIWPVGGKDHVADQMERPGTFMSEVDYDRETQGDLRGSHRVPTRTGTAMKCRGPERTPTVLLIRPGGHNAPTIATATFRSFPDIPARPWR